MQKEKWLKRLAEIEAEHTEAKDNIWISTNELVSMVEWAKDIFEERLR